MKILMTKRNLLFSLWILLSTTLFSQGIVESPLSFNGALNQKYNGLKAAGLFRSGGSISDTLSLGINGFLDDFSYAGPYPDTAKWLDNYVYINRDMPIAPVTIGAATFDGLNANGYPYNFAAGMFTSGKADTLTSKPIDLNYPGDTSVYFSFYYQAQGRGNYPDNADSLILEFKNTALFSNQWKHVWAIKGPGAAVTDSSWNFVMIKITDPGFLRKGFQFRFSNWATLSGNGDHWHIDYVYLNKNRTATDTLFQDVAFVYNSPPLINTYSVMPWKQYNASFMKSSYNTTIRSNNNVPCFGTFEYKVYDENNVQVNTTYSGGAINYDPYSTTGYIVDPACATPTLNYSIPAPLAAKTHYTIESILSASPNDTLSSDTVRHVQTFDNYFAYDDGTAEISWGLQGALHAQMAEKFAVTVGDTLRCIDIFFNPQWTNASLYTFKLKVWSVTGSGIPGSSLFTSVDSSYSPRYTQGGPNWFTRYTLETPLYITAGTSFFIGMEQNTTQLINIGVDRNTDTHDKLYYNISGSWYHPPFNGSLMMHPVFGTAADVVGIDEPATAGSVTTCLLYPNPVNDQLFVSINNFSGNEKMNYTITDIFGRSIKTGIQTISESVDVSGLANGVYFFRLESGSSVFSNKFIISK